MRLLVVLIAPLLGQVTDLAGAEAAVTRVEDSIRAAAADITSAWTGELAAQCEIADPHAADRRNAIRELDAEAHVASSVRGAATTQQTHLQDQVDKAEETYRSASSMKASSTAELTAEHGGANETLQTLHEVVDMIRLRLGNESGAAGEVVGVFNGMIMGTEEQLKTLAESIQEKSAQYSEVMTTAGKEVRALQEMYVEQHQKAVLSAEKLASVAAQRDLLNLVNTEEEELREKRRAACTEAQAGAQAFARRADNLENQAAQTQSVISASLAEVRKHPAKTEVAASAVDALAARAQSPALARLARDLRSHSTEEDLHLLTSLERRLRDEPAGDCELKRMQATAAQTAAREEVLGLQARNATLSAAVALADAQIATLQPVVERTETESTAAGTALSNFQTAWGAGLAAAEAAETELADLAAFAESYVATENATVEGASLPRLIALLQRNVGDLKTETASRSTALTDTVATWNLRTSVLTEARKAKLAALESARSGNETDHSAVASELAAAQGRLDEARAATDEAINCTDGTSLRALERRVARVATAALRPTLRGAATR